MTLCKNKGDRSDCNNYHDISLLSIVGKAFDLVILTRLQSLAARVYPESQCSFRAGWSTIDMDFSIRSSKKNGYTPELMDDFSTLLASELKPKKQMS